MDTTALFSKKVLAGCLLVLSGVIFIPGGILFAGRAIWKWPVGKTSAYLCWERGLVMAAVLVSVLGFVLLERMLEAAGDTILAPLGLATLFMGAVLTLVAETLNLSKKEWVYSLVVVHVVLAFLAQAVFGAALLQTGLLPGWIGWVTIIWNLAWLVILPVFRPHDVYYPWLNYTAPLLIGSALLVYGGIGR